MAGTDRRPAARADAVDRARRALAAMGGSVTGPRRAIVEALVSADRLQTPERILAAAREAAPSTSLATVYRTLERLDTAGHLKRAPLASGAVGYAYCGGSHHDHAICTRCGRVIPVDPCVIASLEVPEGFRVASHELDFYGTCAACSERDVDSGGPTSDT